MRPANCWGRGPGNFLNIFNDSFTAFAYSGSYTAEKDEVLTLHIYNEVAWDGPLGLWASEGTVPGMPLYAGDTAQDATLALQIMTDRSADWPTRLAQSLAPLLAAAAFAAVLLCVWRAPAVLYLAVVGLACGLAFVQVTPALTAPDEYTHLAAAYEQASRWNGQTAADENGRLLVRACDAPYFGTRTGDIGIFAYKQAEAVIEQAHRSGPADTALTVVSEAKAGQGSGSYLPQALGIWLARARGADFYTMLRTGRICNLLLYLALAALAAALAPAGVRGLLACVALLPMPLQLAGSLSPDASVLGTVFCYTALCLRLCGKKAALWEKLLLVVLGGIVGPAKAIYLPVVLLCFVIPADNLAGPQEYVRGPFGLRVRSGRLIQAATLVLAGGPVADRQPRRACLRRAGCEPCRTGGGRCGAGGHAGACAAPLCMGAHRCPQTAPVAPGAGGCGCRCGAGRRACALPHGRRAGPRSAFDDESQRRFHLDLLAGLHLPQPARHG